MYASLAKRVCQRSIAPLLPENLPQGSGGGKLIGLASTVKSALVYAISSLESKLA
jgi:hypothetical protein